MEKRYTNILGTPVTFDHGGRPVTVIRDVLIDPERGTVIALMIDKNKVIAPIDILEWNAVVRVQNWDSIAEADEILRVEEVLNRGIKLFGNKVVDEDGDLVGHVKDFTIDISTNRLRKLYTAKGFLGLVKYDSRIIPAKRILEILADKIVISKDVKVKDKKRQFKIEGVA